jgi:hypothetical protein
VIDTAKYNVYDLALVTIFVRGGFPYQHKDATLELLLR